MKQFPFCWKHGYEILNRDNYSWKSNGDFVLSWKTGNFDYSGYIYR